jgi:hypothetical protein
VRLCYVSFPFLLTKANCDKYTALDYPQCCYTVQQIGNTATLHVALYIHKILEHWRPWVLFGFIISLQNTVFCLFHHLATGAPHRFQLFCCRAFFQTKFQDLEANLFAKDRSLFPDDVFTYEAFLWAVSTVRARVHSPLEGDLVALVPGADLVSRPDPCLVLA